jgi:O-acetyl-ADP-ribose deacetylase (regulator of RNase III)
MEIIYKTGNLLDAQTDVIAHQVNCQGVMGSGVAAEVKKRYPEAFNSYRKDYENGKLELGVAQIFISLIALTVAIYFTLEAKDG